MSKNTDSVELSCSAGLLFTAEQAGKRTASFYLMNTSMNRNRWGVTEKALDEGGPTIRGKPLGMGAGYRVDKHYPAGQTMDCAKYTRFERTGSYLTGLSEGFEDNKVWEDMKAGELGAVSVVINAFDVRCSKCGAEFPASKGVKFVEEHPCIKDGSGYEQVHSFVFKRVDFVDNPAYPQAGLNEMSGAAAPESAEYTRAIELLAGVYSSQVLPFKGDLSQGAKKKLSEKTPEEKLAALEQEHEKLQTDFEAAKKASEDKDTEIKNLKAELKKAPSVEALKKVEDKLAAIEKERHETLVAETLKARVDAGIAGKEDTEKAMLGALDDKTLAVWRDDALKVASITKKQASTPSVSYGAATDEVETQLQAAIDKKRADLGLPPLKTVKQGEKT